MNPHTATLIEIRDWLAEQRGWQYAAPCIELGPEDYWWRITPNGIEYSPDHPFPPTLDGAAAAMPEHWWWSRYLDFADGKLWAAGPNGCRVLAKVQDTSDEIIDRYRLAALCVQAEKESKHGN